MEIIVFDRNMPLGQLPGTLGPVAIHLTDAVRNLGFFMDSSFKLDKQVSTVEKLASINYAKFLRLNLNLNAKI